MATSVEIAAMNDAARKALGVGCVFIQTPCVTMLPQEKQSFLRERVETFEDFNEGNDPWGEHDFGSIDLDDYVYFWKIEDYGENHRDYGVPLRRVLTLMRADEY